MTIQEIRNERDVLDGNINRMFVTDNYGEFEAMYSFAKSRIEKIYAELCFLKFNNQEI